MKTSRAITLAAVLCAIAVILGYVESLIPAPIPIAGVKLGLGNLAVVIALYLLGCKYAWVVSIMKVFLCSMLFGGFAPFLYSLCGAVFSMAIECASKKSKLFSIVGVSAMGGLFHNIGQLLCAGFVIGKGAFYYMPILSVTGILGGFLIGIVATVIIKRGEDIYGKR